MIRHASIVPIALLLTSCMGDATMFVEGSIVDQSGTPVKGCQVLLKLSGREVEIDRSDVDSSFRVEFVVAPRVKDYRIEARCPAGLAAVSKEFSYPATQRDVVELGRLVASRP